MIGSSTNDSFMRNRLTYNGQSWQDRTDGKSQHFTFIWSTIFHCITMCLFSHKRRQLLLWVLSLFDRFPWQLSKLTMDGLIASPSLFPGSFSSIGRSFPRTFLRKAPAPWGRSTETHTHTLPSGRIYVWRGRHDGGWRAQNTCTRWCQYICRYAKQ